MCFVLDNSTAVFRKDSITEDFVGYAQKLIGRQCCFYTDGIQECTIVFKLKIFYLRIISRTLGIKCSLLYVQILSYFELCEQRAFIAYFASLDLSSLCYYIIKKQRNFQQFIEVNKKVQHTINTSFTKFQGASKSTFMLFCSNFYAAPFFFIFQICK